MWPIKISWHPHRQPPSWWIFHFVVSVSDHSMNYRPGTSNTKCHGDLTVWSLLFCFPSPSAFTPIPGDTMRYHWGHYAKVSVWHLWWHCVWLKINFTVPRGRTVFCRLRYMNILEKNKSEYQWNKYYAKLSFIAFKSWKTEGCLFCLFSMPGKKI